LTETINYVLSFGSNLPAFMSKRLHLHDIREGEDFKEAEGKFAKLALSHTVSGPLTL
jgi:hypothetical protein